MRPSCTTYLFINKQTLLFVSFLYLVKSNKKIYDEDALKV